MNARQVEEFKWFDGGVDEPGDYLFTTMHSAPDTIGGMQFICPKRRIHGVSFDCVAHDPGTVWHWDGNKEQPTITPSIANSSGECCGLHVFMRGGQWVNARQDGKWCD